MLTRLGPPPNPFSFGDRTIFHDPNSAPNQVNPKFLALLSELYVRNPHERPQDCDELRTAFDALMGG